MNTTTTLPVTDEQRRSFAENGYFITAPCSTAQRLSLSACASFSPIWKDVAP